MNRFATDFAAHAPLSLLLCSAQCVGSWAGASGADEGELDVDAMEARLQELVEEDSRYGGSGLRRVVAVVAQLRQTLAQEDGSSHRIRLIRASSPTRPIERPPSTTLSGQPQAGRQSGCK